MNNVQFIKAQGGLNSTSPNQDFISGLVLYVNTLPSGFTSNNIQTIYSDIDATTLGITSTLFPIENYQISEFFRINPNAPLWVLCSTGETFGTGYTYISGSTSYTEVQSLQIAANGVIRQIGVLDLAPFNSGMTQIGSLQTEATALEALNMPCSLILGTNTKAITTTNLPDLRSSTSPKVSMIIGQDGSAEGLALYTTYGVSVPALGATLGTISKSKVSENIGWVNSFNVKNEGTLEYDEPCFGNGTSVKNTATAALTTIQNKGYIFLRKFVGLTGTYFNDSPTAVASTSDYAYIERNRTIDKAIRNLRTQVLPFLNGPVAIDPTSGKIDITTIKNIQNVCNNGLTPLVSANELSGFKVSIDSNQNVLSTSILYIVVGLVPIGVAREIVITIGFTLSV